MKSLIELEVFVTAVRLPVGIRFKEWQQGVTVVPISNQKEVKYFDKTIGALERESDEMLATFEISCFKEENGHIFLSASEISTAVDGAIAKLEETNGKG